jgi:hypothetical protein
MLKETHGSAILTTADNGGPLPSLFGHGSHDRATGLESLNAGDISVQPRQGQGHNRHTGFLVNGGQPETEEAIESTDPGLRPLGRGNHALLDLMRSEPPSPRTEAPVSSARDDRESVGGSTSPRRSTIGRIVAILTLVSYAHSAVLLKVVKARLGPNPGIWEPRAAVLWRSVHCR